ncbi:MAG: purine-binding chemotaxis protein CheW [Leptolyngbyaceae cyanobacterium SU_3_3]|nr:purine-binding chemotaxis protein CheW [Leptolyngbyaceae cyanobacterium SU_3_3]
MGDAYLKFEISQGIQAVLPMRQVQEVLVLPPQRLTPMPNMPACILGLTNRRTHVLWVADLANLLEIGALDPSPQQYDLVIVRSHGVSVAIAVKQVDGIFWATPETLQPPPEHVAISLIPYLRGCVLQAQEFMLVLDAESILQSAVFQGH